MSIAPRWVLQDGNWHFSLGSSPGGDLVAAVDCLFDPEMVRLCGKVLFFVFGDLWDHHFFPICSGPVGAFCGFRMKMEALSGVSGQPSTLLWSCYVRMNNVWRRFPFPIG